jgi:hypothetical protein
VKSLLTLLALFALPALFGATAPSRPTPEAVDSSSPATANPLTRDLGRNLSYHRIHRLPADLPSSTSKQPRVLDLRYVQGDYEARTALLAWIKFNASPRTPIFILANSATERDLISPLLGRGSGSVLVIGAEAKNFSPDIAVQISPADERRAYDAFEAGVELSALLTDNPNKVRNDEASLSRDRSTEPTAADESAKARDLPPVDAALQRAVHLHRTLVALRRI